MWGTPLIVLLVGGGLFFVVFSRALPYRYLGHGLAILTGRYDNRNDQGTLSHFQALSTALSGTLGLGNIAGVALAITAGGPGAIFWMWVTAVVGIATKFFTATAAVMYRGNDSKGNLQGGPMYVIREGLGRGWLWLAVLFAFAGLCGTQPVFQINQLVAMLRTSIAYPLNLASEESHLVFDAAVGTLAAVCILIVISGDLKRVAQVTAKVVPTMVLAYLVMTGGVLLTNLSAVPDAFALIFQDAFSATAVAGGTLGSVIAIGVSRGAFSNEAGIGTESMAHGAARTNEPVREGLVAMVGPIIDTLIVCTCTALAILVTGVWQSDNGDGVVLTAAAFSSTYGSLGPSLLTVMVIFLSLSTILTFWYYGSKCLGFLIGARYQHHYVWIYCLLIVVGSIGTVGALFNFLIGMYAVMAIPTMVSALLLAPKIMVAARNYFSRLNGE
ncbi:alanine/glycine:cation symporter family protein [Gilvimarinus sp. SDUM040013]|uniref:Alanine/glycine:cation symporter family protein n=1 Tax=Gilvimarinus gilvus TaxID=3058038 RepID=A0ABU4S2X3_9GAMM|nr:alanine/glycine:cation symporter family protein [Gilvimarinus sp. SDUM040013]MDO3385481.1 alanine/glycine:cation symporter family protein [Gilvimarinus sp. SDUM040013]MDX6851284.1 alanine/glycine:cation symporter family protein [Gilvimarinus sp. SDUM040013]